MFAECTEGDRHLRSALRVTCMQQALQSMVPALMVPLTSVTVWLAQIPEIDHGNNEKDFAVADCM